MMSHLRRVALLVSSIALGSCSDFLTGPDEMAARIDIISGNNQSGRVSSALETPLVVRVRSSSGTPVNGATVRFVPAAGSGFVSITTVLTDTTGTAEVTWTLSDTLGAKRLLAFVAGRDTVEFNATAVPDRLELVSGNNQLARANAVLAQPVIVRVVDLLGRPAAGVSVSFTPASGGGSVVPSVVASDASGNARTVWTLGATLGTKTLQVTAPSVTTPITVSAAATQDQLSLVTGGNQTIVSGGTLPAPVVVRVRDQFGTAVPGVNVTFSPASGSGTVSQGAVLTDNTGTAQTTWTVGTAAGAKSLTVAAGTATPLIVSATALSTDSIQVVTGEAQAGRAGVALPTPIVVRVRDAAGRAVQGASVEFIPDTGSGSVTSSSVTTDGDGKAQTTWTLGTRTGAMRLVARVGATASVAVAATVTRDRLELRSGGAQSARPASTLGAPIVVRLLDLNGAVVAGVPLTFAPSAGSVLPATVVTDTEGQARTSWTLGATVGLQQLVVKGATTDSVIVPATAQRDRITLVTGGGQTGRIGTQLADSVTVVIVDATGAVVPNVAISFATASGSVSPASVTTNAQGRAKTAWTLGTTPGAVSLTASAANTDALSITATATQDGLSVVSGDGQLRAAGTALTAPIVVQLRDQTGALMPGVPVTFTPATGSGTVGTATVTTDAQGQAQTTWTLGAVPGAKSLTVAGGTAAALTVRAIALASDSLAVTGGNAQAAQAGQTLGTPISVVVREREEGRPVPGATVTFTPATGSGTVGATTVITDAQGRAQTTWTLGATTGDKTLTITAGTATPRTVTATATADLIALVSGGAQVARPGSALAQPVLVRLTGLTGELLAGVPVTFTPSAGSVLPATVVTDAQGQARTAWTLGTTPGLQQLSIAGGTAAALSVAATAVRDSLRLVAGGGQTGRIGTRLADSVTVVIVDPAGAVVPNVTVSFATVSGSVSPASVTTNAQGRAKTAWTLGATPGAVSLTATAANTESLAIDATATQDGLTLVSGGDQVRAAGAALASPIVVQLRDQGGAPLAGLPVTFTPAAGSGTVGATTVTTNAQGQAQTTWTLGAVPGLKSLTIGGGTAAELTVRALAFAADSLLVIGGNAQTAQVGQTLGTPISVVVREREEGRPVPGATVTFTPSGGSGTVSSTTVVTDAQGQAQTTWTMSTSTGAKTLTVTAGIATPRTATATATADTSRTLVITAGNNQTGTVTTALGTALSVTVTDRFGNPVPDVPISWTDLLTNGVTVTEPQSLTNASGVATTTARLGVALDSALVRAKIQGRTETVTFLATGQVAMANIAVGNFFSCGSAVDGSSYCWGTNNNGELGKLSTIPSIDRGSTPVTLGDSLAGAFPTFRSLALGRTTACGVTLAKRLVCWGAGNGTLGASTPGEIPVGVTPANVAVGESHTCFIDIDGFGWCGGENALGQLGNITPSPVARVTADSVSGKVGSGVRRIRLSAVALGRSFSCGFRQLDPSDATTQRPVCWGDNALGQLGRNSTSTDSAAIAFPVADPLAIAAFDSTSLVTGLDHACVLSTAGNAYCWGSNGHGQLGNGGAVGSGQRQLQMVAVTMPSGQTFTRLAAGEYHTCGITAAGAAYCWGRNGSGQLGDGTQTDRSTPTAVAMPGGVTFKAISLGELHSCAIAGTPPTAGSGTTSSTGRVFCWGDNEYGQLGDGAASGNRSPVLTPKVIANQP